MRKRQPQDVVSSFKTHPQYKICEEAINRIQFRTFIVTKISECKLKTSHYAYSNYAYKNVLRGIFSQEIRTPLYVRKNIFYCNENLIIRIYSLNKHQDFISKNLRKEEAYENGGDIR